jgi:hypothetical protein
MARVYKAPTAYSFLKVSRSFPDGTVETTLREYDCWGTPKGPQKWRGLLPKGQKLGKFTFVTLKMQQGGCCPPALMKDYIQQEGGPAVERDAAGEALKLHKRGYFGGRG